MEQATNHPTVSTYETPRIVALGGLVELTAQGAGGFNKPCGAVDGLSGTIGNCSGGGIGS